MTDQPRSTRTRIKSQRALESAYTDILLRKAKVLPQDPSASSSKVTHSKQTSKDCTKKRKSVAAVREVYCVCKSDGMEGKPMIECGDCSDWFHFDCVDLSEDEAERIHKYVCSGCEDSTGGKTSYTLDIATFPSPTPPPGFEQTIPRLKPVKKVKTKRSSASPDPGTQSPESSDSGSEADPEAASSNDDTASQTSQPPHAHQPLKKRQRIANKPIKRESIDRRGSGTIPPPRNGALPPARAHVLKKLGETIKTFFEGSLGDEEVEIFALEMEGSLWANFKDVVGGKDTVGVRYKAQFNVLTSSLNASLRTDLRNSILSGETTPRQIATLTPVDLASKERLEEIEKAKQLFMEQHVKGKGDSSSASAIRLGRDGFEQAEDRREVEMRNLRRVEERARVVERKASVDVKQPEEGEASTSTGNVATPTPASLPATPIVPQFTPAHRRSESTDVPGELSPVKSNFALKSAWGGAEGADGGDHSLDLSFGDDQAVDLSDIPMAEEEVIKEEVKLPEKQDEWAAFLERPLVWSGSLTPPDIPTPTLPLLQTRLISTSLQNGTWSALFPSDPISITGRVPSAYSLKYISDSRFSTTKEMCVVAFRLDPGVVESARLAWTTLIDTYIQRDRHGVYIPYGNDGIVPPGGAKEIYLIPLRPEDPSPEFTDLVEGYSLPSSREESIMLGVFIAERKQMPIPIPVPLPDMKPRTSSVNVLPSGSPSQYTHIPAIQPLPLPNDHIQALMARLNPASLQGILGKSPLQGGSTPGPVPAGYPAIPPPAPYPGTAYPGPSGGYPSAPAGWAPTQQYPAHPYQNTSQEYNDQAAYPYVETPHHHSGSGTWERERERPRYSGGGRDYDEDRNRGRDVRGGGRGGGRGIRDGRERSPERARFAPKESDKGWASRGRGGGGGGGGGRY